MINELTDFHIHTAYRPGDDGAKNMTVPFLVDYAEKHGYKKLGITPHFFLGNKGEHLRQIQRELDEIQTDIPIYLGTESDFTDCGLNIAIDSSAFAMVDYVIGAADHFNCGGVEKPPVNLEAMIDYQHQKLLNITKHPWVDVIAHPWTGLMLLTTQKYLPDHSDDEHLFPGEGIIPWAKVLIKMRKLGFDGPVTIECPLKQELMRKFTNLVCRESRN